jgi:KaiC/GvpD/RAD55 family RecA-like ATPase
VPDPIYDRDPELRAAAETERKRYRLTNGGDEDWRGLELIRFADMQPRLDGRPLVKGLLDREQISVIYGEAGCGKTFLALDLGLHVAAGFAWSGRRVDQGGVVYVAAEAGRSIVNRVAAWRITRGFDGKDIPFVVVTSPIDLCHVNAGDVDKLVTAVRSAGLDPLALLEIDTVSRALAGGNENAPDDMGAFVRSMDRLRDDLRCHVSAVHHSGKNQSLGSRGHSLLRCAVDTEIEVARDHATKISTATVTKQRDGATDGQIAFRLRQIELGRNQDGDPVTSCVVEPTDALPQKDRAAKAKLSSAETRALELLSEAITKAGEIPPACDHIPAKKPCVAESLWREYCYAGQITGSNKPDARQKAFRRAAETLIAYGHVGKWGTWIWIIRP